MARHITARALIFFLTISCISAFGQTKPKQTQSAPPQPLQTQKPEAQPLEIQKPAQSQPPVQAPGQSQKSTDMPPQSGEAFMMPLPKGWKQVSTEQFYNIRTTLFVPDKQSADKWEEIVRSRAFFFVKDAPLETFLLQAIQIPKDQCQDVVLMPVVKGMINGYASASTTRFCTRDKKSGLGEVAMFKAIQGSQGLYIGERVWRIKAFTKEKPPVPQETYQQWAGYMGAVLVCDARDPKKPCPRVTPKQ